MGLYKKHLISFGSPDLKKSIDRFYNQAKLLDFYDEVKIFSLNDLNEKYFKLFKKIFDKEKKVGFGYWYWKPLIIKQYLENMNEGDILSYVDLGCHLNLKGKEKLESIFEKTNNIPNGFLAFQFYPLEEYPPEIYEYPDRTENLYTKSDTFSYFNVINNKNITDTQQYCASYIFLKKNLFTINFINSWIKIFEEKFNLVNDSTSKIPNNKNFIRNTHDQSIYSILCKLNNIECLSAYQFDWFYYKNKRYWDHTKDSPIISLRDKKYNIFKRFLNRQIRTFRRIRNKYFSDR